MNTTTSILKIHIINTHFSNEEVIEKISQQEYPLRVAFLSRNEDYCTNNHFFDIDIRGIIGYASNVHVEDSKIIADMEIINYEDLLLRLLEQRVVNFGIRALYNEQNNIKQLLNVISIDCFSK